MKPKLSAFFALTFIVVFSTSFIKNPHFDGPLQTSFTVPQVSITGLAIKNLAKLKYDHITLQIELNGNVGTMVAFATSTKSSVDPWDVTPLFIITKKDVTENYPCVFGNMTWAIKTTGINPDKTYILDPVEESIAVGSSKHTYLKYVWADPGNGSPPPGGFNPVPPKIALFDADKFKGAY